MDWLATIVIGLKMGRHNKYFGRPFSFPTLIAPSKKSKGHKWAKKDWISKNCKECAAEFWVTHVSLCAMIKKGSWKELCTDCKKASYIIDKGEMAQAKKNLAARKKELGFRDY